MIVCVGVTCLIDTCLYFWSSFVYIWLWFDMSIFIIVQVPTDCPHRMANPQKTCLHPYGRNGGSCKSSFIFVNLCCYQLACPKACYLCNSAYVETPLIMQIYANFIKINEKCYFSVISWPILILFVLSDRAWCGLQNFYTEFWNSLIIQIYANLFKINEKCYFSVISWPILILFVLSDRAWSGLQNFYTEFWNSLIMQIYANLFKINEKCYFSSISWPILILFFLSDRAWWGLQNFYTVFWNSLIMQIYSKSTKNATLFLGRFWFCLVYLIGLGGGLQNFYTEFWNSLIMQIYSKLTKNDYFSTILGDFDSVCFIW